MNPILLKILKWIVAILTMIINESLTIKNLETSQKLNDLADSLPKLTRS